MNRNGRPGSGSLRDNAFGASGRPADVLLAVRHGGELSGGVGLPTEVGRSLQLAPDYPSLAAIHRTHRQSGHGRFQTSGAQTQVGVARLSHVSIPLNYT